MVPTVHYSHCTAVLYLHLDFYAYLEVLYITIAYAPTFYNDNNCVVVESANILPCAYPYPQSNGDLRFCHHSSLQHIVQQVRRSLDGFHPASQNGDLWETAPSYCTLVAPTPQSSERVLLLTQL